MTVQADVRDGDRRSHNVETVDSLEVFQQGKADVVAELGASGSGSLVGLIATEPVTILSATPYRMTDATFVAARALFQGVPDTYSPGGYWQTNGSWVSTCVRSINGFSTTYPVEGLKLAKNDSFQLVWYYTPRTVGNHALIGYRITYQNASGQVRIVTGDHAEVQMKVMPPGTRTSVCGPGNAEWVADPVPGFPS